MNACINMLDGVVQRHFSHLRWEHPEGRAAFRHNSQLQETPAAGPKANQLRRERRAQPGHATPETRTAWRRRVEQRRAATATATTHMLR